jgi:6-pyruvoyl-tetrahydropterin synthase
VENLVLVRKKSREIRLYVDFHNLNQVYDKDNYPVPSMERILQLIFDFEMFSLLDRFFIYNQVLVAEADLLKTTFHTKWGMYAYQRIPFGLINVVATFQHAMDIVFKGLIGHTVVVYLDDVTVFQEKVRPRSSSETYIQKILEVWYLFKSQEKIFVVLEGKLLGTIISKKIQNDPNLYYRFLGLITRSLYSFSLER